MSGSPLQAELDALDGLFDSGRLTEVIDRGEKLSARFPESFIVYQMLGTASGMLGRPERAVEYLRKALQVKPDFVVGHLNLGVALEELGHREEAVAAYQSALQLEPGFAEAYFCLGVALHALGRLDEAVAAYEKALQIRPEHAETWYNLASVLQGFGSGSDEAIACCRRALEIRPDFAEAHLNLGVWLHDLGRIDEAIACCRRALEVNPDFAEAYLNLGIWLQNLDRSDEAIACVQSAIRVRPDFAAAHLNLGVRLQNLDRIDEAAACYRNALRIKPDLADAHLNLGVLAQNLGRTDEAIARYGQVLRLKPEHAEARSQRLYQQAQMCDWDAVQADAHLIPLLGVSGDAIQPFTILSFDDNPQRNRIRSERYAAAEYRRFSASISNPPTARSDRMNIGYFSADFHNHATMHLMAGLFELHDRTRFSVHLFSYGPDRNDEMLQRVKLAADAFHDVRTLTDREVAALAQAERIDIAIDLKGYTGAMRLGIFACRAAPVQISYLGYPGTLGATFIDYIVADRIVIPEDQRQHYLENILYLPDSYQVNDDSRAISDRMMTRAEMGLPEDGFVFCCFNNNYKISAEEFDIWMRLLDQVGGSVLWLLKANQWAEGNLRREAHKRGIDADRLIFADRMPLPQHLARHALADLFLDTFNYNAHTTASDALWAGLPLITRTGQGFAARVASSLLTAVGLPELITSTSAEYESLALELARDPRLLSQIRARLASNRLTAPLFDTRLFTRHIETAYERAYEGCLRGRPAADILIEQGRA